MIRRTWSATVWAENGLARNSVTPASRGAPDAALGTLAQPSGRLVRLWAAVASADGRRLVRADRTGPLDEPELLGAAVARRLTERGAAIALAGVAE